MNPNLPNDFPNVGAARIENIVKALPVCYIGS